MQVEVSDVDVFFRLDTFNFEHAVEGFFGFFNLVQVDVRTSQCQVECFFIRSDVDGILQDLD